MNSSTAHQRFVTGIISTGLGLSACTAFADVIDFSVTKEVHYQQTSSLPPSSAITNRFAMYLDTFDAADATSVSINGNAAIQVDAGAWDFVQDFPDLTSLDAAFPSTMPYTVTVSGGTLGTLSETVNLPLPQLIPAPPALTPESFDALQLAPSDDDLIIELLPPDANTNVGFVELYNANTGDEIIDDEMVLGVPYTISAGLLDPDTPYELAVIYANGTFATGTPGGFGTATEVATGYVAINVVGFTTSQLGSELEFDAGVVKVAGYNQTAPDNQPSTVDSWSFEAFYDPGLDAMTMGTVLGGTAPADMVEYLPGSWDADGPDYMYTTKAELDANYPSSQVYTMDISGGFLGARSQPFFVGVDSYPEAPYLVGSSFSDLQGMDPSSELTISWNPPSANVNLVGILIDRTSDLSKVFEVVMTPDAGSSINIPSELLQPSESYEMIITFGDLDINNGDGSPGFDSDTILLAGYLSDTTVSFNTQGAAMCSPDLTGEGDLNFLDVSAFLSAFGNQDPIADYNTDGNFNFLDVSAFLSAFSAGCP